MTPAPITSGVSEESDASYDMGLRDAKTVEDVLLREETYLTEAVRNADDMDGPGIMPGDVEGSFHRIRAALAAIPARNDALEVIHARILDALECQIKYCSNGQRHTTVVALYQEMGRPIP